MALFSTVPCPKASQAKRCPARSDDKGRVSLKSEVGWADTSFRGNPQIPTPNLDALASSGIILNNYYVLHTFERVRNLSHGDVRFRGSLGLSVFEVGRNRRTLLSGYGVPRSAEV
ncbi:hypothetical protein HPB47_009334 [Ixodes persulcatus]|uniref:Uncharacterized protein n=1 Tax=Ixodes persulcatus TaxID=34615 RepID=A0AC60P2G9_IXOPE|nr:hypothetical protein HPB47_009334 [Ixodes persulcatus]